MNDVEFTPLPESGAGTAPVTDADLTRLTAVTVELTVEVGRTHMSLGETMSLGQGSVDDLEIVEEPPPEESRRFASRRR